MNAGIFSLSWDNLDDRVLAAQRRVFGHLGVPLRQHRIDGFDHGEWMDWVMHHHRQVDLFLFVDADAVPLNPLAVQEAFERAGQGALYGNAQVSHHIDPNRLFAAPSWCAVSRQAWVAGGCPSARVDRFHDVGQRWTENFAGRGMRVELLPPQSCVRPLWRLPNGAEYGIGTTFGSGTGAANFHLFGVGGTTYADAEYTPEVRLRMFEAEADRVCAGLGAAGPPGGPVDQR